ncbi:hypothetical protein ACFL20_06500 [Spirochaetota bacterium]
MTIKYDKYKYPVLTLLFLIILLIGYIAGKFAGSHIVSGLLVNKNRVAFLLYRPAKQYFEVYRLINSENELKRLSGYYSLLDNKIVDVNFLSERYFKENSSYVKRTIIWILGRADDFGEVMKIYKKIYKGGDKSTRRDIIESVKRRGEKYHGEFLKLIK